MDREGPHLQPLRPDDPRRLGDFRLLGRIGAGGMGRVYLGETVSGRRVAVKTLLTDDGVAEIDRRRFAREAELARRVNGVFTVSVVAADPTAPQPWIASEYVPAPSLADLVRGAGPLPPAAVRWIAAGLAEALADLHRADVVHRDVKPANVLLPPSGPRLLDFGISHATDLTRTVLTLGTIAFTSPEQARGEESTGASDVYAMGATLVHLALGRPPYESGTDALRLLNRVQRADVDLAGLPPELTGLIRSCLAPDPAARPTPDDLLVDFARTSTPGSSALLPEAWMRMIRAYEAGPTAEPPPATRPEDAPAPSKPAPESRPERTESFHVLPTRTAPRTPGPPRSGRVTSPAPVPAAAPVSPRRASVRGRRGRAVLAALASVVGGVAAMATFLPDALKDTPVGPVDDAGNVLAVGDCFSNRKVDLWSEAFLPPTPRKTDCGATDARLRLVGEAGADGDCGAPEPGGEIVRARWPVAATGSALCVSPVWRDGDCLESDNTRAGPVIETRLWTAHPCGEPDYDTWRIWRVADSLDACELTTADPVNDLHLTDRAGTVTLCLQDTKF